MKNFLNLKLNRKKNLDQSCDQLLVHIENFFKEALVIKWINYFEKFYGLPRNVVEQECKNYLAESYDYIHSEFSPKLRPTLKSIAAAIVRHLGLLVKGLVHSKFYSKKFNRYDIILDGVNFDVEIARFTTLLKFFEKPLVITELKVEGIPFEHIYRPYYQNFDILETVKTTFKEVLFGLPYYLYFCFKVRINLLLLSSRIINRYLYFSSIYRFYRADFCIQERHYHTSAIKNFLFKGYGGLASSCIQKNIIPCGHNGFYYDADIMFSLGERTLDRAIHYGSKIKSIVPVGSTFMEYYLYQQEKKDSWNTYFDLVLLGHNLGDFLYSYEDFEKDYYEHFRWVRRLADEYPLLKVGLKHHKSNKGDPKEAEVLKGSKVIIIDKNANSYEVSFKTKCLLAWGSTLGYEMLGHGRPTIFLDPERRNVSLLPSDDILDPWRVTNYDDFKKKVLEIINGDEFSLNQETRKLLCLESSKVSSKIYQSLQRVKGSEQRLS